MTLDEFTELLDIKNKVVKIIKYNVPGNGTAIEKYVFKKKGNKIISFMNGKQEFKTDSITHIYFIYRKALKHKNKHKKRHFNKRTLSFGSYK